MTNIENVKKRARGAVIEQIDRRTTRVGMVLQMHVYNLRSMGSSLRDQGLDSTGNLVEYAANRLGVVSNYLVQTDGDRVVHDIESVAREHTAITGAVGLVLGFTAARLLKASASNRFRTYAMTDGTSYGT